MIKQSKKSVEFLLHIISLGLVVQKAFTFAEISAIEIPGENRSLVIKIIAQQIIFRKPISQINTSGYFGKYFN